MSDLDEQLHATGIRERFDMTSGQLKKAYVVKINRVVEVVFHGVRDGAAIFSVAKPIQEDEEPECVGLTEGDALVFRMVD